MKIELNEYIKELKNNKILQNIPVEFLLPNLPVSGKYYNDGDKILFLGQDTGNISSSYENVISLTDKEKAILEYNDSSVAFDFNIENDNFIEWYRKYHFWELPIRISLKDKDKKETHKKYTKEELMSREKELQSFTWGNVSSLIFPHYLKKNILSKPEYLEKPKINFELYNKAFEIEQSIFLNPNFYMKYFDPNYIIVSAALFSINHFFKDVKYKKITLIEKLLDMYSFNINNKEVLLFWTNHATSLIINKQINEVCVEIIEVIEKRII
jgi:hypothetical protein